MLSIQQFDRMRRLALGLAGIELVERHRELLDHRSRRLGIRDSAGLDSLLDAVEKGEAAARQKFFCLLTTKFTGFFRHPSHFDIAAEHALRAVQHRGRARLWSAATATGEEPYSLAMALLEVFRSDNPPAAILATDVDEGALAVARLGEYGEAALQALQPALRERFFAAPASGGRRRIAAAARRLVEFRTLNLVAEAWPADGPFDVIFCRNVLMYLQPRHRNTVLERISSVLAPDGLIMIDPTEHLGKAGHLFVPRADAVYARRSTSGPEPGSPLASAITRQ